MKLSDEEIDQLRILDTRYHTGQMDAAELKDNAHLIMRGIEELLEKRR